jgi:enolase
MTNWKIENILARRVWDSRGRPTVEAEVHLGPDVIGRAIAPAGASRGEGEAIDLRDPGEAFGGFGVEGALRNVNGIIRPALCGLDVREQARVDAALIALDGTPNKARLGGNATVAVSLAVAQAAAAAARMPLWRYLRAGQEVVLPLPEIQIFGGGLHAGGTTAVQDFMVMAPKAASFSASLVVVADVYHAAGRLLSDRYPKAGVADEGGWWPQFRSATEALDLLMMAIERAGYVPGEDVVISLDIAASHFGRGGTYRIGEGDGRERTLGSDEMVEELLAWMTRYPIAAVEDPLAEDDPDGLRAFTAAAGDRAQVVGDDYLVTDADRIRIASAAGICNAALIKPNQAGTVTEALSALEASRKAGWSAIVSARSGETEDVSVMHLCVGWGASQVKVGSFARSERMAKWNEGIRIEEAAGPAARFAGEAPLKKPAIWNQT